VRLLSGATRETLQVYRTDTPQAYGSFGISVSAGGDVDDDGVPDLAVGSAMDVTGLTSTGALYIVSGATGDELYRIDGAVNSATLYGDFVGDVDDDGVADFVCAEPYWHSPDFPSNLLRGRIRVSSGADGSMLWEAQGAEEDDRFGWPARGVGDVNGDGFPDLAVSAPNGGAQDAGEFLLLSGPDGAVLDRTDLPAYANAIAAAPYFDEGGRVDVIVGMPKLINNGGARVYACSQGGVHGFVDLGNALAGTGGVAPRLDGHGELASGGQVSLKVRKVKPGAPGYWFFSLDTAYLPFRGGVFVPDPVSYLFVLPLFANGSGEFFYTGTNPPGIPSGLALYHQFWFLDPGAVKGASATNGLAEIFK